MPGKPLHHSIAVLAVTFAAATAHAEITVRDDGKFVLDRANVIAAPHEQQLQNALRELEDKTTVQVKVLTVQTMDGEDIFSFSQRHAVLWKLGVKGKNNGALIVMAVKERKLRIQTGYGLEGVLPDSWCGSQSRTVAAKYFKRGQYSPGLYDLTTAVIFRVAKDAGVQLTSIKQQQNLPPAPGQRNRQNRKRDVGRTLVFVVFFGLILLTSFANIFQRRRRGFNTWGGGGSGRSSWGSSNSWGSSGGFGGSDFGGGGSFGGGGDFGGGGGGASW